jgi:hypothetical protein
MTDSPASQPPKRKLRWYQFSLRTLLIVVTLFGIACSWLTIKVRQAKRQRIAAEMLRHSGCFLRYNDSDKPTSGCPTSGYPTVVPAPRYPWLKSILGEDVVDPDISQDTLALLKDCPHLQVAIFVDVNITDEGLENIAGLQELQSLNLDGTRITDNGLRTLRTLPRLSQLSLVRTEITDKGLENLKSLKGLQVLSLTFTAISDDGLETLSELQSLSTLYLGGTKMSTKGVERLRRALPNTHVY